MIRRFQTKDGFIDKTLTKEEVDTLADRGDLEAKREQFKRLWALATTTEEKFEAIARRLM